ncbi:MAG: hypothetical protein JWO80_3705 [Bryobacterales bacterium]|nr:hypothetical protein [Bryobacterales bacterium]
MTDDVRKLLGGYATGTLTTEESELLFQAALADQELFNTLADEQSLGEMLEDRRLRGELLAALGEEVARPPHQALGWIFSGAVAVSSLIIFWIGLHPQHHGTRGKVFQPPPPSARPAPVQIPPMEPPPPLPPQAVTAPPLPLPSLRPIEMQRRNEKGAGGR